MWLGKGKGNVHACGSQLRWHFWVANVILVSPDPEKTHSLAKHCLFFFSLFPAMQQKSLRLSHVALEVLRHHREPPLATDLPHHRHHSHHPDHGRIQHGKAWGGHSALLGSVLALLWCQLNSASRSCSCSSRCRLALPRSSERQAGFLQQVPTCGSCWASCGHDGNAGHEWYWSHGTGIVQGHGEKALNSGPSPAHWQGASSNHRRTISIL